MDFTNSYFQLSLLVTWLFKGTLNNNTHRVVVDNLMGSLAVGAYQNMQKHFDAVMHKTIVVNIQGPSVLNKLGLLEFIELFLSVVNGIKYNGLRYSIAFTPFSSRSTARNSDFDRRRAFYDRDGRLAKEVFCIAARPHLLTYTNIVSEMTHLLSAMLNRTQPINRPKQELFRHLIISIHQIVGLVVVVLINLDAP